MKTIIFAIAYGLILGLVSSLPTNSRLPKDVSDRLASISKQSFMSEDERNRQIDSIIRTMPIGSIPLPSSLLQLPKRQQEQARSIIADKTMSYEAKARAFDNFVDGLPSAQKQAIQREFQVIQQQRAGPQKQCPPLLIGLIVATYSHLLNRAG